MDANPNAKLLERWKNFISAHTMQNIKKTQDALNPQTVHACCHALWSDCISDFRALLAVDSAVNMIVQGHGKLVKMALVTSSSRKSPT